MYISKYVFDPCSVSCFNSAYCTLTTTHTGSATIWCITLYECTYVRTYVCTYVCTCVYSVCMHVCTYVCTVYVRMCVHMYVSTVYIRVHMFVRTYVCTYVCTVESHSTESQVTLRINFFGSEIHSNKIL